MRNKCHILLGMQGTNHQSNYTNKLFKVNHIGKLRDFVRAYKLRNPNFPSYGIKTWCPFCKAQRSYVLHFSQFVYILKVSRYVCSMILDYFPILVQKCSSLINEISLSNYSLETDQWHQFFCAQVFVGSTPNVFQRSKLFIFQNIIHRSSS